jgi:hypothetical protein
MPGEGFLNPVQILTPVGKIPAGVFLPTVAIADPQVHPSVHGRPLFLAKYLDALAKKRYEVASTVFTPPRSL